MLPLFNSMEASSSYWLHTGVAGVHSSFTAHLISVLITLLSFLV